MTVSKVIMYGNVNVGVYVFSNNKLALIPKDLPDKVEEVIVNTLQVQTVRTTIFETRVLGIFIAGNDKGILLPYGVSDEEYRIIKSHASELGILVERLPSKFTALGNMILANNKAALVHPEFEDEALRVISDVLDVPVEKGTIANIPTVGSVASVTDIGLLAHPDTSEEQLDQLKEFFKVDNADVGTVNFGVSFIRTGLIVNTHGAVVGDLTTGPEIVRIENVFGLAGVKK